MSGKFSVDTCSHLIHAIANVSGDAPTAFAFIETIEQLYDKMNGNEGLDRELLMSLVKMTFKAPILLEKSLKFMRDIHCIEGIEILSRRFIMDELMIRDIMAHFVEDKERMQMLRIISN